MKSTLAAALCALLGLSQAASAQVLRAGAPVAPAGIPAPLMAQQAAALFGGLDFSTPELAAASLGSLAQAAADPAGSLEARARSHSARLILAALSAPERAAESRAELERFLGAEQASVLTRRRAELRRAVAAGAPAAPSASRSEASVSRLRDAADAARFDGELRLQAARLPDAAGGSLARPGLNADPLLGESLRLSRPSIRRERLSAGSAGGRLSLASGAEGALSEAAPDASGALSEVPEGAAKGETRERVTLLSAILRDMAAYGSSGLKAAPGKGGAGGLGRREEGITDRDLEAREEAASLKSYRRGLQTRLAMLSGAASGEILVHPDSIKQVHALQRQLAEEIGRVSEQIEAVESRLPARSLRQKLADAAGLTRGLRELKDLEAADPGGGTRGRIASLERTANAMRAELIAAYRGAADSGTGSLTELAQNDKVSPQVSQMMREARTLREGLPKLTWRGWLARLFGLGPAARGLHAAPDAAPRRSFARMLLDASGLSRGIEEARRLHEADPDGSKSARLSELRRLRGDLAGGRDYYGYEDWLLFGRPEALQNRNPWEEAVRERRYSAVHDALVALEQALPALTWRGRLARLLGLGRSARGLHAASAAAPSPRRGLARRLADAAGLTEGIEESRRLAEADPDGLKRDRLQELARTIQRLRNERNDAVKEAAGRGGRALESLLKDGAYQAVMARLAEFEAEQVVLSRSLPPTTWRKAVADLFAVSLAVEEARALRKADPDGAKRAELRKLKARIRSMEAVLDSLRGEAGMSGSAALAEAFEKHPYRTELPRLRARAVELQTGLPRETLRSRVVARLGWADRPARGLRAAAR